MAHSQSEVQVLTFAKNLLNYVFTITQKSPLPVTTCKAATV